MTTKLFIPTLRPELVSRPRLIERLNAGLHSGRTLTLISAPAGFGKTTLLSEWIHFLGRAASPISVGWLSLDKGDNDPARFLAYVIAAVQTVGANIGQGSIAALHASQPRPPEAVYQIRVQSCLDEHWTSWFEGMDLTRDEAQNTTTLTGTLPDQAALHGILARIRDLRLPLVSLARLEPPC